MKINNMEKKGERWTNRTTGAGGNKTEKLKKKLHFKHKDFVVLSFIPFGMS